MGWIIIVIVALIVLKKVIWWLRVQSWLFSLRHPRDIMEAQLLINQHRRMRRRK